jgi:alkylation response protein AidB-like acyl-CoA dehydrogenase
VERWSEDQAALTAVVQRIVTERGGFDLARQGPAAMADLVGALDTIGLVDAAWSGDATLVDLAAAIGPLAAHATPIGYAELFAGTRLARQLGLPTGPSHLCPRPGHLSVIAPRGARAVGVVDGQVYSGAVVEPGEPLQDLLRLGPDAIARVESAVDEWRALSAIGAAAAAGAALALAVRYVSDRHQFGVPIGSFQTVAHRLADAFADIEGATVLADRAISAVDASDPDGPALASMAFLFSTRASEAAAALSLHLHGGYGFMLEYDIQLLLRRAKTDRIALGDPATETLTLASRLWGDDKRGLQGSIDPEVDRLRDVVRNVVAESLTSAAIETAHRTGTMHDPVLHQALSNEGLTTIGWPTEHGGQGGKAVAATAVMQELYRAGAPVDAMAITAMVGATIAAFGTDEQRRAILPRIVAGEVICCLGYTEADAGSDIASVTTRAIRDGDDWIIDGQKMFTTMAHIADYVFLFARTDLAAAKHKGLTMFLVPMSTPGISVVPVDTLGGERTNLTFYDAVRFPDHYRIGDINGGWSVMTEALVHERTGTNWGESDRLLNVVLDWARRTGAFTSQHVQSRLAGHATAVEVGRLLLYRAAAGMEDPVEASIEAAIAKLVISEAYVTAAADYVDLVAGGPGDTDVAAECDRAWRHSHVTTIYAGASEILRGVIARRRLRLPT